MMIRRNKMHENDNYIRESYNKMTLLYIIQYILYNKRWRGGLYS